MLRSPPPPRALAILLLGGSCAFDPADSDRDGDGLSFTAEAALGTDPYALDSDQDGYDDGQEVRAGTHPLNPLSHPYLGGYRVGACPPGFGRPSGTGLGEVPPDLVWRDLYGEELHLHAFCGLTVLLMSCAVEGSCEEIAAAVTPWLQDEARAQVLLAATTGADEAPLSEARFFEWGQAQAHPGLPIVHDPGRLVTLTFDQDDRLPTAVILDPELRVLGLDVDLYDPRPWLP